MSGNIATVTVPAGGGAGSTFEFGTSTFGWPFGPTPVGALQSSAFAPACAAASSSAPATHARQHDVEILLARISLGPRRDGARVADVERRDGLGDEADLLLGAVDQSEILVREGNGQRNAGKAPARAHVH